MLFDPIVVENHPGCPRGDFVERARKRAASDPRMTEAVRGLETYEDKEKRNHPQFVDGGITDNLGLLAAR
ncbi:MAG: hypothetical protein R3F35_05090 [Myxococcota bacterium]